VLFWTACRCAVFFRTTATFVPASSRPVRHYALRCRRRPETNHSLAQGMQLTTLLNPLTFFSFYARQHAMQWRHFTKFLGDPLSPPSFPLPFLLSSSFLPFFLFPFPSPSFPLSCRSLPLEVGPSWIPLGSLGERCKLPQRGLERSPSRNQIW